MTEWTRTQTGRTSYQVDDYRLNRSCWGSAWVASAVAAAYSASARSSPSSRRPPKSGAAPSLPSVGRPSHSATSSRLRAAASNPCRRLSRACPLCWNPGTGPQTSKSSPSDGRRCHFVLLLDHTLRRVLLFFSRHLRVINLGCTLPIAKLALSSEGFRVPHVSRGGMHAPRRFVSRRCQLRPFCGRRPLERRRSSSSIRPADQPGYLTLFSA